jgi:uracil-DNA glycosylase
MNTSDAQRAERLAAWLAYFGDLGLGDFYRARTPQPRLGAAASQLSSTPPPETAAAPGQRSTLRSFEPWKPPASTPLPASLAQPGIPVPAHAGSLFEAVERIAGDTLARIREDLGDCTRCRLCEGRHKIVFGEGSATAELVFVGEGPGREEDAQGLPFVGRAGQLLTQMIEAMGLRREQVYICNVVKCRPPENRTPEKDEVATCSPFLFRQLEVVRPKVIVCLGNVAAQALLGTHRSLSSYRGQWLPFRGAKLLATYHPAYLLRNPHAKGEVWADLKKVIAQLGLPAPKSAPPR